MALNSLSRRQGRQAEIEKKIVPHHPCGIYNSTVDHYFAATSSLPSAINNHHRLKCVATTFHGTDKHHIRYLGEIMV